MSTSYGPGPTGRRVVDAAARVEASAADAAAANPVRHAPEIIRTGTPVIIVCRVSVRGQNRRGGLRDQERVLRMKVRALGGNVIALKRHTGNGRNPVWLRGAAAAARVTNAVLLAESDDRFVRCEYYGSKKHRARGEDFDFLLEMVQGARLATVVPPGDPERPVQTCRGLAARPSTAAEERRTTRDEERLEVLAARAAGLGIRDIARQVFPPTKAASTVDRRHATVGRWVSQFCVLAHPPNSSEAQETPEGNAPRRRSQR